MSAIPANMVELLRRPTPAKAIEHYERQRRAHGWPYPKDASLEVVAMACVHKARLAWDGSTKAMVRESRAWLVEHGMAPDLSMPNLRVQ